MGLLWLFPLVTMASNGVHVSSSQRSRSLSRWVRADDKGTVTITDDDIPAFSASGAYADALINPDLVAPGRNIVSQLASDDTNLALQFVQTIRSHSPSGSSYFRISGTSMASAVIAGAVALLLQDEPTLTPDQVKYRLHDHRQHELG